MIKETERTEEEDNILKPDKGKSEVLLKHDFKTIGFYM